MIRAAGALPGELGDNAMRQARHSGKVWLAILFGLAAAAIPIVLVGGIGIVVIASVFGDAKRMMCSANSSALSKGLSTYTSDPANEGRWPWINGTNWDSLTGTNITQRPTSLDAAPDEKRADIGVDRDNIYSAGGADTNTWRGSVSTKLTDHTKMEDSFLIGPYGK